jgi:hypothetical protein
MLPTPLGAAHRRSLRILAALVALGLAWHLMSSPPLVTAPNDAVFAGFRVAIGSLLVLRIARLWRGRRLLWLRGGTLIVDRYLTIEHVLVTWGAAGVCLGLGLGSPIAALCCWLAELYVFRRSYTHSLEDTLFQLSLGVLILLPANRVASLDALLGRYQAPSGVSVGVALEAWWFLIAIVMFSAGLEKLLSPVWRRSLGVAFFLGLPHLVQPAFRSLRRWERACRLASWATVVAELSLLPALSSRGSRDAVTVALSLFACGLFVIVDLSFIGQVTLAHLSALLLLDLLPNRHHLDAANPLFGSASQMAIALTAASLVIVSVTDPLPPGGIRNMVARVVGWTVGLKPLAVFTDQQLYGFCLYRVVLELADGTEKPVLPTFCEDGSPGPMQRWRPRVFLKMTYEVTDLCLLLRKHSLANVQNCTAFAAVEALARSACDDLARETLAQVVSVKLFVRAVRLRDMDGRPEERFEMTPWQLLGQSEVEAGRVGRFVIKGEPPDVGFTARSPRLA